MSVRGVSAKSLSGRARGAMAACVMAALGACTAPDGVSEFNDPYEARNRRVHESNTATDKALVRPVAMAYGTAVPGPVRTGVSNFADNLSLPGAVLNSLLQLRPGDAAQNTTRFFLNSTIGIAGLFDPATAMGAYEVETDFGETLHVWGVREGAYLELPVVGPTTERDFAGKIVDVALNPLRPMASAELRQAAGVSKVFARIGDRHEYSDLVDSLLYESADSYAQTRLIYLQTRRHKLGRGDDPDYFDPYDDPYQDPYADPYEDPYDQ